MLLGIDTSYYDPILDWERYNLDFVFIKGSEGTFVDPDFKQQWKAARGRTIRGAYHFFRPKTNAVDTARYFVDYMEGDYGELPPVLDLEDDGDAPKELPGRALKWLHEVERLVGKKPIVYTSPGFASRVSLANWIEFRNYKLWQATYPWDSITSVWSEQQRFNRMYSIVNGTYTLKPQAPPRPWLDPARFWQFTAKLPPEFISGYFGKKLSVDGNVYFGTIRDLFMEFGITNVPTPEGETPMPDDRPITLTADLISDQPSNLRNAPGIYGTTVKRLLTGPLSIKGVGQKVSKDNYWWIEIVYPEPGWVALTTSYTNVVYPVGGTTTKKLVKSVLHFDDNSTQELFPKE